MGDEQVAAPAEQRRISQRGIATRERILEAANRLMRRGPEVGWNGRVLLRELRTQGVVITLPVSVTLGDRYAVPSLAAYIATTDDHGVQVHQYAPATIRTALPDGRNHWA